MNDITYTFNQTSKERKALVPSAMKRTNGSKSHRCTLPSDLLTPAQQRKLNGPVRKYSLSEPMGWESFKAMPKDLQAEYLADLYERFGVGSSTISRLLFGLSHSGLSAHCISSGIKYPTVRGRISPKTLEVFRAWVSGDLNITEPDDLLTDTTEPVESVESVESVSSVEPDIPTTRNTLTLATLHMAGTAEDVLATLRNFLTCEGRVELEVTINFKEENKQ